MDAIADKNFLAVDELGKGAALVDELPSLLTVIIDIYPLKWFELKQEIDIKEITSAICIMLNSHLLLNGANKVAVLLANDLNDGAKFLYPTNVERELPQTRFNSNMYRQFKMLDEVIVDQLNELLNARAPELGDSKLKNTMSSLFSMALSYINKMSNRLDELIKSRILVISLSDDSTLPYISTMNCIFAAQKMRVPIDVVKFGSKSVFLQQASDSTSGVYQLIQKPKGLVQYLASAFFIDPSLRQVLVLPTDSKIDFRASCFITNKIINIGYVCSVCLCILSIVPPNTKCPVCDSKFDELVVRKLRQKPSLAHKKRKPLSH